jgi:hypothetical protein
VDGDGRDDVAMSAAGQDSGGSAAGAVYLFTQAPTGTMSCSTSDAVFIGESAADSAGFVAPAGDADADGLADILVGAPYNAAGGAGAGASYLLLAEGL